MNDELENKILNEMIEREIPLKSFSYNWYRKEPMDEDEAMEREHDKNNYTIVP